MTYLTRGGQSRAERESTRQRRERSNESRGQQTREQSRSGSIVDREETDTCRARSRAQAYQEGRERGSSKWQRTSRGRSAEDSSGRADVGQDRGR